jgi:hypothetical protein
MRSASERLVCKLFKATEGRPGMWLSIIGLGATQQIASDAERRGWVATVGGHSIRLTEAGRQIAKG